MGHHNNFSPENFILPGEPGARRADAEVIISGVKRDFPEKFEGNADFFAFELRYTAPFDKGFTEIRRLQGTAAKAAGRRDEFRGYIVIDLSSYLTHHDEAYLNIFLLFLSDMSDCWKYVFLINDRNGRAAKELIGKTLSVLIRDNIPCEIRKAEEPLSFQSRADALCRETDAACSPPVRELLQELLKQDFSAEVTSAFLREASWHCGRRISMSALAELFSERESIVRFMLTPKEYSRFISIMEQQKENWYGEKEAI